MRFEPAAQAGPTPQLGLLVEAEAPIPTRHGTFRLMVFRHASEPHCEHVALTVGEIAGEDVLVRVHSECLTSEVFGSLKCDCADQLDLALARVANAGRGAVLYLRQEGRGIGLANKIRAYALQAEGVDTVDANRALGLPDDARSYAAAAAMLGYLGVRSVQLMTNNPLKVEALAALGVPVHAQLPSLVGATVHSAGYLAAKRDRMRHALPARLPLALAPTGPLLARRSAKAGDAGARMLYGRED